MPLIAIEQLLTRAMKRARIGRQVSAAMVVDRAHAVLRDYFGLEILDAVKPLYVRNRILAIACVDMSAGASVGMVEDMIVKTVNEGFDEPQIERITLIT